MITTTKQLSAAMDKLTELAEYDLDTPQGQQFIQLVHDVNQYNGTNTSAIKMQLILRDKTKFVDVTLSIRDIELCINSLKWSIKVSGSNNPMLVDDASDLIDYLTDMRRGHFKDAKGN